MLIDTSGYMQGANTPLTRILSLRPALIQVCACVRVCARASLIELYMSFRYKIGLDNGVDIISSSFPPLDLSLTLVRQPARSQPPPPTPHPTLNPRNIRCAIVRCGSQGEGGTGDGGGGEGVDDGGRGGGGGGGGGGVVEGVCVGGVVAVWRRCEGGGGGGGRRLAAMPRCPPMPCTAHTHTHTHETTTRPHARIHGKKVTYTDALTDGRTRATLRKARAARLDRRWGLEEREAGPPGPRAGLPDARLARSRRRARTRAHTHTCTRTVSDTT